MCRSILSASVSLREEAPAQELRFDSGINLLCGQNAEEVVLTLAGILDIYPSARHLRSAASILAEICWPDGVVYGVFGEECDGRQRLSVHSIKNYTTGNRSYLEKRFHKQRFRDARETLCFFDGSQAEQSQLSGEYDSILHAFYAFIENIPTQKNGRPLFLCGFLERLDEAVDLRPIFEALNTTGRQVFIAVPHYYPLEEIPYDIHIL